MTEEILNIDSLADQVFNSLEILIEEIINDTKIDTKLINSVCLLINNFKPINRRGFYTEKINMFLLEIILKLNIQLDEDNRTPEIINTLARTLHTFTNFTKRPEDNYKTKEEEEEDVPLMPTYFDE